MCAALHSTRYAPAAAHLCPPHPALKTHPPVSSTRLRTLRNRGVCWRHRHFTRTRDARHAICAAGRHGLAAESVAPAGVLRPSSGSRRQRRRAARQAELPLFTFAPHLVWAPEAAVESCLAWSHATACSQSVVSQHPPAGATLLQLHCPPPCPGSKASSWPLKCRTRASGMPSRPPATAIARQAEELMPAAAAGRRRGGHRRRCLPQSCRPCSSRAAAAPSE